MTVYILLMAIALLGYVFKVNRNEVSRKRYLIVVFFFITITAMARGDQIGIDLSHYYNKYYPLFRDVSWSKLQSVTISGDWEWGFCAFCKLIGYISTSTQCFIVFTSIFTIVPYAYFIYKNSDDVIFSTVFFIGYHILMMSMNVVRQAMAVGIILLGLESLKRKQYFKFLLFVLIGTLFHTSAIVAVLLIMCDKMSFKKNTFYLLAVITVIASLGYRFAFEKLLSISSLSSLYGIYSSSGTGDSGGYVTFHTLGMFLIALAVFVYGYFVYNSKTNWVRPYYFGKNTRKASISIRHARIQFKRIAAEDFTYWSESMLMYSAYLAVLFRFSAFIINVTARFSLYFIPFLMVAFPHFTNKSQTRELRILMKVLVVGMLMLFFVFIGYTRAGALWGTVPYKAFWE